MKHLSILLSLLLFTTHIYSQNIPSKSIDSLVQLTLKAFDVPGIAVGVVKDGKLIHAKGYGLRSLDTKQPVDAYTLFGIASNSKAFTAAALGILVDEKKINWDDKVIKYIPEFQLYDPWVTKEFTIRDLLTHRSGMAMGAGDLMFFPDSANFTTKDVIYNLRYLKPVSSFRSKFDYDNNLYIVAGEVLARVSGMSWNEFIEKRILTPIGMSKSASTYSRIKDKSNVIDAHGSVNGKVQVIARHFSSNADAAGGMYSSIDDLGKWIALQLNHGKYGDSLKKHLISDEVHNEMWTLQTIIPISSPGYYNSHFGGYGLGFFLKDVKGYKQIDHTGGMEGMVTQITMLPELNLGIIVLTNQQEGLAFTTITNSIKDYYLKLPTRDWLSILNKRRKDGLAEAKLITDSIENIVSKIQKQKVNKEQLMPYLGKYNDPWLGDITISLINGKAWFKSMRSPKLNGSVFQVKDNMFMVKWTDRSMDADAYLEFKVDVASKQVTGLSMKAISPLTDFSYDFQDLDFKKVE